MIASNHHCIIKRVQLNEIVILTYVFLNGAKVGSQKQFVWAVDKQRPCAVIAQADVQRLVAFTGIDDVDVRQLQIIQYTSSDSYITCNAR